MRIESSVTAVWWIPSEAIEGVTRHSAGKPSIRTLEPQEALVEQRASGHELYILLDGVMAVEVDGRVLAEIGPGAILGEGCVP